MSANRLAELLDTLHAAGDVFITEAANSVSISNLSVASAREIFTLTNALEWRATAFDNENTPWEESDLSDAFSPYRITFSKPSQTESSLWILTNVGLTNFLRNGHLATTWRVARFGSPLRTLGRLLLDWQTTEPFSLSTKTKNPRLLVRESTTPRIVPEDIRPWILLETNYVFDTPASKQWANICIAKGISALADEIDSNDRKLKFKGPPRLSLVLPEEDANHYETLGNEAFQEFQHTLGWIYENEREAEIRHILFASEIARSRGGDEGVLAHLHDNIFGALEGAKIAYQMSISEIGKDTLKTLSDLRKAITEDTAKVADATRQTVTAVASALALGLGLVAARLTTTTAPWLIFVVMLVIALYVSAIIYSGYAFIRLQRQLRIDWQPRLYRFLPDSDYERMVTKPASLAERTFTTSAIIGATAVITLTLALGYSWLTDSNIRRQTYSTNSDLTNKNTKTSSEESQSPKTFSKNTQQKKETIPDQKENSKVLPTIENFKKDEK